MNAHTIEQALQHYGAHGKVLVNCRMHFEFNEAGDGGRYVPNANYRNMVPGDTVTHSVAAPGIGNVSYRITDVDRFGAWGVVTRNTVRIMTAREAM